LEDIIEYHPLNWESVIFLGVVIIVSAALQIEAKPRDSSKKRKSFFILGLYLEVFTGYIHKLFLFNLMSNGLS